MHDPMVVAHEIPSPIPRRARWQEMSDAKRWGRWGICRRRRTNTENLGEPVYRWWRPAGWVLRLAGRSYRLGALATVWHVEPGGRDAFEVCKHASRWRWHVWHWKVQIHWAQKLRRFVFERCIECGHRFPWGYAPIAGPHEPWGRERFRVVRVNYHHQCSSVVHLRTQKARDEQLIRALFAALRVERDESEYDTLAWLTDARAQGLEFWQQRRLWTLLGYKRDDNYLLVPAAALTREDGGDG